MGKMLERGIIPKIQARTGYSKGYISKVIDGINQNPDIQREYARIKKAPVRKLFPKYKPARKRKEAANG